MVEQLIALYGGLLWEATAVAVWYNASTNDRGARRWAVVALLTGVFGAVVYLLLVTADEPDPEDVRFPTLGPGAGTVGTGAGTAYQGRRNEERDLEAALEAHLESTGGCDEDAIRDALYPEHSVGFDSTEEWWTEFVEPILERRDDVERREGSYRLLDSEPDGQ